MALETNPSDPLFQGASNIARASLIPIKLIVHENYGVWSRLMKIELLGKRKYGFITGTCRKNVYKEELHEQWETCNIVVLSRIMSSIS